MKKPLGGLFHASSSRAIHLQFSGLFNNITQRIRESKRKIEVLEQAMKTIDPLLQVVAISFHVTTQVDRLKVDRLKVKRLNGLIRALRDVL